MLYLDRQWREATGDEFASHNPATGAAVWTGRAASPAEIDSAMAAARRASGPWSRLAWEERAAHLERFAELVTRQGDRLAETISREVGKPLWEAATEAGATAAKIPLVRQAFRERRSEQQVDLGGTTGRVRYKPLGVAAVFGPFNFPSHIANGQIAPALLAGNTVVFKPSELTPAVGEALVRLWDEAGLPPGVLNLVQGGRSTGEYLSRHAELDGLFFTGSLATGLAIRRALVDRPEVLLALELGGNNPLIVHEPADVEAAAYWTVQSAFLTAGQRCTAARRLIVVGDQDEFLARLVSLMARIRVGPPEAEPPPFMGPLIHAAAADRVLEQQASLIAAGGKTLVECQRLPLGAAFVSPGLIDVTECDKLDDEEVFGPLLHLIRTATLDEAIAQANATRYGLAAGIFTRSREAYEAAYRGVRSGLLQWNRPTTGASGRLPFGGLGRSGNHRPAGYFAADFCDVPVASHEAESLVLPSTWSPGLANE